MSVPLCGLPGLFVVGTDTGVGKTWVAAAIARALVRSGRKVGVLKPVATGAAQGEGGLLRSDDAQQLGAAIGGGAEQDRIAPVVYEPALAPPVAARLRGAPLEPGAVRQAVARALAWWAEEQRAEVMVIEGIGGLLCPLAEGMMVADLAITLDLPLVIVARRGLGTLNHTLLTVEAAQIRGLRVAGIILNGAEPTANALAEATAGEELARRLGRVPVLAEVGHVGEPSALSKALQTVDWYERARPPRLVPPPAPDDGGDRCIASEEVEP